MGTHEHVYPECGGEKGGRRKRAEGRGGIKGTGKEGIRGGMGKSEVKCEWGGVGMRGEEVWRCQGQDVQCQESWG